MWSWKREKTYSLRSSLLEAEDPFTPEEKARLCALRQRLSPNSEFLLGKEKHRLMFLRWLVEHDKLGGDKL
jgi:hypothetical protein